MSINTLIDKIKTRPDELEFEDVIQVIESHYHYFPTTFTNGMGATMVHNAAGTNEGSCKIFAFALQNKLNKSETLACFGKYYRDDVLQHPDNTDHANIRNFMQYGWNGIKFEEEALSRK
ncbi:MAG: HopJ type III effector protein [Gammaproteobacteria bacterium]|nr:HopJ type III effector protein [Gammaproteobacteria bacterium]